MRDVSGVKSVWADRVGDGVRAAGPGGCRGFIVAISDLNPPLTDRRARAGAGPRLFERGPCLAELEAIFSRALQVPSRCIAVEGTWGSGRTALVNAACDAAGRSECLVLRARGGTVERQVPFSVLGKLVESAAGLAASTSVSAEALALQGLLRAEPGVRLDPADVGPLFHSLVMSLRSLGPVLLAVDDADLADRETLAVLEYLVRRLDNQQVWLLVTARPLHPGEGLRPVDGLLTDSETRQFILEPLHEDSVRMMLAGFFGEHPDEEFVVACARATGGIPLFLKTLLPCLSRWQVRPVAAMAARVERVPAPKFTQLVLGRLAQLPVAATDLLQACAVLGDGAEPNVARQLAKIDGLAAERAADAAGHMELLESGRPYAFRSPLIRWAVYYDIPTARRSQLHARAAELLAEHGAPASAVAEHLLATEPIGDTDLADRLQQMGRSARAGGDPELALRCFDRALAESPSSSQGTLALDLASVETLLGRPSALSNFTRAVRLGVAGDTEVVRVAVDLLHAAAPGHRDEIVQAVQGLTHRLSGVDRSLGIEFELALTLATTRPDERRAGLERLTLLLSQPEGAETGPSERRLSQMASTVVSFEEAAAGGSVSSDELVTALEPVIDGERLASADPMEADIQAMAILGLVYADRYSAVDEPLRAAQRSARELGDVTAEYRASILLGTSLLRQGSLTGAEEAYRRSPQAREGSGWIRAVARHAGAGRRNGPAGEDGRGGAVPGLAARRGHGQCRHRVRRPHRAGSPSRRPRSPHRGARPLHRSRDQRHQGRSHESSVQRMACRRRHGSLDAG